MTYTSATELLNKLHNKQISALELLEQTIKHIETHDDKINAVIVRDFDRAKQQAIQTDKLLAQNNHVIADKPLLGLPMTVKECFRVQGLTTNWGEKKHQHWLPEHDSLVIERLKQAGAIIIGKTNVPAMLKDWQTYNDIYGTTNNPYDLSCHVGGSSGGSAAALAAGFVSLELGSDMGGSLRSPAHSCGIYAHRPSMDVIPNRGSEPPTMPAKVTRFSDLVTSGPMARTVADLQLGLKVLQGADPLSLGKGFQLNLPKPRQTKLQDFRVLVLPDHPLCPVNQATQQAFNKLSQHLTQAGCKVEYAKPDNLPDLTRITQVYLQIAAGFISSSLEPEERSMFVDMANKVNADDNSLTSYFLRGFKLSLAEWMELRTQRINLRQSFCDLFSAYDVILYPCAATEASAHDHRPMQQRSIDIDGKSYSYSNLHVWASLASLFGLPATAVPIGMSATGLPIGMQIMGDYLEDETCLAFAALLERDFYRFTPPLSSSSSAEAEDPVDI